MLRFSNKQAAGLIVCVVVAVWYLTSELDVTAPTSSGSLRNYPTEDTSSASVLPLNPGAADNSATGQLFQGHTIRTFDGPRYSPTSVDEAAASLLRSPRHAHCRRWGVVTTIFAPNQAIARVPQIHAASSAAAWCLVIVPDHKTPSNYMEQLEELLQQPRTDNSNHNPMDNIVFLSVEQQTAWEKRLEGPLGAFVRATPWNHFCRKNIGYLFAIVNGATVIFDFDDDNYIKINPETNRPYNLLPNTDSDDNELRHLVLLNVTVAMQGALAFNHHPMMGASVKDSWARGFPLELIQNTYTRGQTAYQTNLKFLDDTDSTHTHHIGVIQFLADGNPDIDAIHRLTRPLPMTFPLDGAPSVLVPRHAYVPYNAQATLHTHPAVWATLLPGTVPGRVSDIWRSYFSQCLFADAGLRVVLSPPKILQERNAHDYLADMDAEDALYCKAGKLLDFLSIWDAPDADTIPKRMEQLWIDLYERGYIEVGDVQAVQLWLGTLQQIGYEFPPLQRRHRNIAYLGKFNYADSPEAVNHAIFWTQKIRERFTTVLVAGPFSGNQMHELQAHSIDSLICRDDAGYVSPHESLRDVLVRYQNDSQIDAILYAHDDMLVNVTELSQGGMYPFPTDAIMPNWKDNYEFIDPRSEEDLRNRTALVNSVTYRVFPDGHYEDMFKTKKFTTAEALYKGVPLFPWIPWGHFTREYCIPAHTKIAQDPASAVYREDDGSLLIMSRVRGDYLFVPTRYANAFAQAADLHIKYNVFLECAFGAIVDWVRRQTGAPIRRVLLHGADPDIDNQRQGPENLGVAHPYKIGQLGFQKWSYLVDKFQ